MRYTIPYWSTSTNVIRFRPGKVSTPNTSFTRKEWIPRPEVFMTRGPPRPCGLFVSEPQGLRRAWPQLIRSPKPPPPTEAAAGALGRPWRAGGPRPAAGGRWYHRVHEADALVEHRFCETIRGERTKVETLKWRLKAILPCLCISPYFWFPDFPLFWDSTV